MNVVASPVMDAGSWNRHPLHAMARDWPETNCYTDLWVTLLHARREDPTAMLGFLAAQAWEGDHFTFFKPPPEDLRRLYGAVVQELPLYEDLAAHAAEQLRRGHVVLVEVDAWFLPDVAGTAYRRQHSKTTIGLLAFDAADRRLRYIHNTGLFDLHGEDYDGVFWHRPDQAALLFPYAEVARFLPGEALAGQALRRASRALLAAHLAARPPGSPVRDFIADLPRYLDALARRGDDALHRFSFNTLRQLGAACELLSQHILWLAPDARRPAEAALEVSAAAKALQFVLARQLRRGVTTAPEDPLLRMAEAHERLFDGMHASFA